MAAKCIASLTLVFLLATCTAAQPHWTPSTYPNPTIDVEKCGRKGVRSWICDPDGVISYESANVVEGILKKIAAGEPPYIQAPCGRAGPRGFQVAVALMRNMYSSGDPAKNAERFARALHDSWGVGNKDCDNGALFFLSINDRQLYVSTGAGTTRLLTYDVLGNIIDDVRPILKGGRYSDAVERGVVDIGLALAGRDVEPQSGGSSGWGDWAAIGIFVSVTGGLMYFAGRTENRKRRRYQDCKSKLEKLKRDQAAARTAATYNPTSCPVCLEDFTPDRDGSSSGSASGLPSGSGSGESGSGFGSGAGLASGAGSGAGGACAAPGHCGPKAGKKKVDGVDEGQELRQPLVAGGAGGVSTTAAGGGAAAAERRPLVLPCGHAFCEPCITAWLDQKKVTCPICRKPMDEDDVEPAAPRAPDAPRQPRLDSPTRHEADSSSAAGPSFGSGPRRPPCTVDDDDAAFYGSTAGGSTFYTAGPSMYSSGAGVGVGAADGMGGPRLRLRWGRRRPRRMDEELLMAEMMFRLRQLQRQHPEYVTHEMQQQWERDLREGREFSAAQLRDFQLRDPATRAALESSGSRGSGSSFGGGGSGGGGGRGGSW